MSKIGRSPKSKSTVVGSTDYVPKGDTLVHFLHDQAPSVKIILGPQGSGKSVAAWMDIRMKMYAQAPDPDGIRRTRWLVVRNTYPELEQTTLKTYLEWFPEDVWGEVRRTKPMSHVLRDGDMEAEVIFLALDSEDDIKKLMSFEFTGAYVNEIRYMDLNLFSEIKTRCGRYPQLDERAGKPGASWYGVIADTNMPETYHWLLLMYGITPIPDWMGAEQRQALKRGEDWLLYKQPPGLIEKVSEHNEITYVDNPKAENKPHLKQPYTKVIEGKTKSWINANIMLRPAPDQAGMPVYPSFRRETMVSRSPLVYLPSQPVAVGVDFGRSPALVAGQYIGGRWYIMHEFTAENIGATTFAPLARRELYTRFPNATFRIWGDPSGDYPGEQGEMTAFGIMRQNGLQVNSPPGNNRFGVRKEAVEAVMTRSSEGKSGLLVDYRCQMLIGGFEGGYHYRRLKTSGGARYTEEPDKQNSYSHPHDALQYLLLGEGEGTALLGGSGLGGPVKTRTSGSNVVKIGSMRGVMRRGG